MNSLSVRAGHLGRRIKRYAPLLLMMLPGMIFFIVFCYVPMYGVVLAFKDLKITQGIMGSPWVGLKYFEKLFETPKFWEVLQNTVFISALKLFFGFFPPIIFALLLNELRLKWFKKLAQTVSYLPYFISWIIMAGIIIDMLSANGIINQIVTFFGGPPKIIFLSKPEYFRTILVATDIWKGFGWGSIIYISSISTIDPTLYEAATVDGAGRFKQAIHVTLPCLIPVITIQLVLSMSGILNAGFDQIFNLINPSVSKVGEILDIYVYNLGIAGRNYSMSTAVGLFKSIVALILILGTNFVAGKLNGDDYTLW